MAVLDLQGMTIRPQQEAAADPSAFSVVCGIPDTSHLSILLCV
jgi:SapB morphogen precursor RamS